MMNSGTAAIDSKLAEHRPYLLRFARRRLHDAALAEDVVQDTLVAALQGAAGFAGRASARTWLTGILLRRIADTLRRETRLPRAAPVEDSDAAVDDDLAAEHSIDWQDPQRRLEARQSLALLEAGLRRLPATAARIVVLREVDGLSNEETARELGLPPASVSLWLHRARSQLRQNLN